MYHPGNYFMCDCCLFSSEPLTYNCLSQIEYWKEKQILEASYLKSSEAVRP